MMKQGRFVAFARYKQRRSNAFKRHGESDVACDRESCDHSLHSHGMFPRTCRTSSATRSEIFGGYNACHVSAPGSRDRTVRTFATVTTNESSDVSHGKFDENITAESAPRQRSLAKKDVEANIVVRKPIPKNFIRETFLPHLEHNVAYNAHKFPPAVVLQIGIAYSKLPAFIRQRAIEDSLVQTFIERMVDYSASDCVQLLNTSLQLQGLRNLKVYKEILKRLQDKHVFGTITVLNRLGLVRNISRILQRAQVLQGDSEPPTLDVEMLDLHKYRVSILKPWTMITSGLRSTDLKKLCSDLVDFGGDSLLPQLEFELQSFDSNELTDLLGVFAERAERDSAKLDFPIIAILMQRIIELDDKTPLSNKLANVCSLCRLGIAHDRYLSMVANQLHNPLMVNNIFHRHLARALWAFARFGMLGSVIEPLLPHLERNALHFEPSSMARLSQIYSGESATSEIPSSHLDALRDVVVRNALSMITKLDKFTPKELLFFYTGLCYMHLLPEPADFALFVASKDSGVLRYVESVPQGFDNMLTAKGKTRTHIVEHFLHAVEEVENDFDLSEIQRILSLTQSMEHAQFVLQHLPVTWSKIIEEHKGTEI
ncbi:uncharacterized protein BXIN_1823 [Babesia sp. Xinjiang]|uniref:uncharacterized protein n=1 Tax=Babesia sp. Xinjiang TaxID=462227 RepID=UPI000A264231|nr:uncharacterized protein BXIN_1268 [Babesia sp. Xinjiang]XP_028872623.1 uncharacterized protein BXIN_1823 [Babesia sp. Xinjiang]ORM40045.1 hypothetical protein BXIN_1268 [Babesia sp. Xinjiang]ORM42167.1 hypothetical protein BXIN_1823 [Babesia sp. Xinjiang]